MNELTEKLSSSMPFRVGLVFTFFYLICFTIGALVFYFQMHGRILNQLDQELVQRYQNIRRVYEDQGMEEAIKVIRITQPNNPTHFGIGFQIVGPNDEILSGNMAGFERRNGFYDVNGEELGFGAAQNYRFYTNTLGEHTLTLGLNGRLLGELRENSISSFFLTFVLTTILALIGAILLASRSHARVRKLVRIMENVGKGNLSVRLPISYRGDDIDRLSGEMNNALSLLQKQVIGMQQVGNNIAHDLKTPLNRLNIKIEEAILSLIHI